MQGIRRGVIQALGSFQRTWIFGGLVIQVGGLVILGGSRLLIELQDPAWAHTASERRQYQGVITWLDCYEELFV